MSLLWQLEQINYFDSIIYYLLAKIQGIVANVVIIFKIIKYIAIFLKNYKYSKICQNLSMVGVYHS